MRPLPVIALDYAGRLRTRNRSYAQSGEDRVAAFALHEMGIDLPSYLDLGAHHATWLSNTYYFYRRGSSGVCVEADPDLLRRIKRRRPRDACLNVAIGPEDGRATFYVMNESTLSTLSDGGAEKDPGVGSDVNRTIEVEVLSPTTLLTRHCPSMPQLVSLDVEGLDLEILAAWDFERHRPEVFIIETLEYSPERGAGKIPAITKTMVAVDYLVYADTHINTVYVDGARFAR